MGGTIPPLPHTPSQRGAKLKHGAPFYLCLCCMQYLEKLLLGFVHGISTLSSLSSANDVLISIPQPPGLLQLIQMAWEGSLRSLEPSRPSEKS